MTHRVESGQIWADQDKRRTGRLIRIDEIKANFIFGTVIANMHSVQDRIDTYGPAAAVDRRGSSTRIGIARLYDGEYELVEEDQIPEEAGHLAATVVRLPQTCVDLTHHRWVPVALTLKPDSQFIISTPAAYQALAVCPKCWAHTTFPSTQVPSPNTPGDIAA
ncbi:hypothetical protein ACFWAP_00370 [Streptomyces goshikiensis]|uniref:hypothetical protein n=1 Tax=Streptomyces goshikiensis TaxID=1942 RepID=UPI00365CAF16